MTNDIVKVLRDHADDLVVNPIVDNMCRKAANEIERLREEVKNLHEAMIPSILDCIEHCDDWCQRDFDPIEECACFKAGVLMAASKRSE